MNVGAGHWRMLAYLPFVAAGLLVSGCAVRDDDLPRQPVAGTVLLDGRRLAHGTIMFYPTKPHTKGDDSVPAGDVIVGGRFSIPRRKGPIPGKYTISIYAETNQQREDRADREAGPGNAAQSAKQPIPAKFNSETELEVEIEAGGIKDLKIEIESE